MNIWYIFTTLSRHFHYNICYLNSRYSCAHHVCTTWNFNSTHIKVILKVCIEMQAFNLMYLQNPRIYFLSRSHLLSRLMIQLEMLDIMCFKFSGGSFCLVKADETWINDAALPYPWVFDSQGMVKRGLLSTTTIETPTLLSWNLIPKPQMTWELQQREVYFPLPPQKLQLNDDGDRNSII